MRTRLMRLGGPSTAWSRRPGLGYAAALAGVAAASAALGVVEHFVHVANLSLVYLLVVLWLAATFGRGPAVLASVLAFLAYDYFFIPPRHMLTVDDPTQWISLSALLATALVLGQLTAIVQQRAHEARESQRRTETLYALAQLVASAPDEGALQRALVARVARDFASEGVGACALFVLDGRQRLQVRAVAPDDSPFARVLVDARRHGAQALAAAGEVPAGGGVRVDAPRPEGDACALYFPLRSGARSVGVLGVAGPPRVRVLAEAHADAPTPAEQQRTLFAAVRDQIALALDHAALQQSAIHAEALRESDRLKTALLGSVTHDLRTPIASIQAATGSLLDREVTLGEADRRTLLEAIETSAQRLGRLVSNLLDLSRLEAGVAVPQKRWYPIGDVIATVLDRLELAGRTEGREVEIELPDDLPLVPLDHAQMEQVVTNLLENALKYSPPGSPIRVRGAVDRDGVSLLVGVADEGIGIPADALGAVFDKFYRVQRPAPSWSGGRQPPGTGLGLAICADILKAHGGRIWAESTLGKGTTVTFALPIPAERPRGALPAAGTHRA
jgi:two-component system sensor histidine kinase KdpD